MLTAADCFQQLSQQIVFTWIFHSCCNHPTQEILKEMPIRKILFQMHNKDNSMYNYKYVIIITFDS